MKQLLIAAVAALTLAGTCGERAGAQDDYPQALRVGVEEMMLQFQPTIELEMSFLRSVGLPQDVADENGRQQLRLLEAVYTSGFVDGQLCKTLNDDAECARILREIRGGSR